MNTWVPPLVLRASARAAPCAWAAQHEGQEAEGGGGGLQAGRESRGVAGGRSGVKLHVQAASCRPASALVQSEPGAGVPRPLGGYPVPGGGGLRDYHTK